MRIISVVGARPNFMKVAPLHRAFQAFPEIESLIVHTGQHYDEKMSKIFFDQLEMPRPYFYLGVGSGSHAEVTARVMVAFEEILLKEKPDLVLVVGDVNSTLACALATKKLNIPLAHVEAGLRSGDRTMPEEINRILTDSISDYLFVTEQSGMVHLAREGVPAEKIFFTGNVMIDSLCYYRKRASESSMLKDLGVVSKQFTLMTMHRPANVDKEEHLTIILNIIRRISAEQLLVFPLHPRTKNKLENYHLLDTLREIPNVLLLGPLGYLEFLQLMDHAAIVVTDSGGIQEETTFLQVPCLTIRDSTERPVTTELGTNILIPQLDEDIIVNQFLNSVESENKKGIIPPLWDGKAANRIAAILKNILNDQILNKNRKNITSLND